MGVVENWKLSKSHRKNSPGEMWGVGRELGGSSIATVIEAKSSEEWGDRSPVMGYFCSATRQSIQRIVLSSRMNRIAFNPLFSVFRHSDTSYLGLNGLLILDGQPSRWKASRMGFHFAVARIFRINIPSNVSSRVSLSHFGFGGIGSPDS